MKKNHTLQVIGKKPQESETQEAIDLLGHILKEGARKMLAKAVEEEVNEYILAHRELRDSNGLRMVMRNGYAPERTIQTELGDIL